MDKRRRLNLSFNMASPLQKEAWERLYAIPAGQRTDAVCQAVCRMYEQDRLAETLRAVIREELQGVELITEKGKNEQPQEAGDLDDNVLGFLLALQNDGGDDFSPSS